MKKAGKRVPRSSRRSSSRWAGRSRATTDRRGFAPERPDPNTRRASGSSREARGRGDKTAKDEPTSRRGARRSNGGAPGSTSSSSGSGGVADTPTGAPALDTQSRGCTDVAAGSSGSPRRTTSPTVQAHAAAADVSARVQTQQEINPNRRRRREGEASNRPRSTNWSPRPKSAVEGQPDEDAVDDIAPEDARRDCGAGPPATHGWPRPRRRGRRTGRAQREAGGDQQRRTRAPPAVPRSAWALRTSCPASAT